MKSDSEVEMQVSSARPSPSTLISVPSSEALDLQFEDLSLDFLQPFEFDLAGDV